MGASICIRTELSSEMEAKASMLVRLLTNPSVHVSTSIEVRAVMSLMNEMALVAISSKEVQRSLDGMHHLTREQVTRNEGFQQVSSCAPSLQHLEGKVVIFRGISPSILGNTRIQSKEMSTVTRPQYVSGEVLFCGSYEAALTVSFYDNVWYPDAKPIPGYASTGRFWAPFYEFYRLPVLDTHIEPFSRLGGLQGGYWAEVLTGEYNSGVGKQCGPLLSDREKTICDRPFTLLSLGRLGPPHSRFSFVYDDTGDNYEENCEMANDPIQNPFAYLVTYFTHDRGFTVIHRSNTKCVASVIKDRWVLRCNCSSFHAMRTISVVGKVISYDYFFRRD